MDALETDFLKELDVFDFPLEFSFGQNLLENNRLNNANQMFVTQTSFSSENVLGASSENSVDLDEQLFGSLERAFFPEKSCEDKEFTTEISNIFPMKQRSKRRLKTNASFQKKQRTNPLPLVNSIGQSKSKTKQKRTKWLRKEVQDLWEGIATFGNNWRLIKKQSFGHRTYYQVKDKGRRILSSQGWSSGRTKATHDGAAEEAKNIAGKMLADLGIDDKRDIISDNISNVGSTGTPVTSETDFDFNFELSAL